MEETAQPKSQQFFKVIPFKFANYSTKKKLQLGNKKMNGITSLIRRGDIERKIKLTKIKQKYGHNSDVIRFIYSHSSRDFFYH